MTAGVSESQAPTQIITQSMWRSIHSLDSNGWLYSWFAWKASTNTDHYALYLKLHNLWTEQWHHSLLTCETLWTPHALPHTHTHLVALSVQKHTHTYIYTQAHRLTIACSQDDLRCDVLRCTKHLLVPELFAVLVQCIFIQVGGHWKNTRALWSASQDWEKLRNYNTASAKLEGCG